MIKLNFKDINTLPDEIKEEVLKYAEYLIKNYKMKRKSGRKNWLKKIERGYSQGESASETVEKIRREEEW